MSVIGNITVIDKNVKQNLTISKLLINIIKCNGCTHLTYFLSLAISSRCCYLSESTDTFCSNVLVAHVVFAFTFQVNLSQTRKEANTRGLT